MINMYAVTREAVAAKPYADFLNPNWRYLFRGKFFRWAAKVSIAKQVWDEWSEYALGDKTADEAIGDFVGRRIVKKATAPARDLVFETHKHMRFVRSKDLSRKNGLGGRTFPWKPDRVPLVIIFHDANRAGAHIDVHIGRFSLIRRVKPEIYDQLSFNREGQLTQKSRDILLDFLKDEIDNGTRTPVNLDHTLTNARMEWIHDPISESRIPPDPVSDSAQEGLRWHIETGRGGTDVGIDRARQLMDKEEVTPEDFKSMASFFARHAHYKEGDWKWQDNGEPTNGYIAHLLWGGDEAEQWVEDIKNGREHKWQSTWRDKLPFFDSPSEKDHIYGSGKTRQIVVEDEALIYKAYPGQEHFEFYAPALNPSRGMYVHQLYGGDEGRAPIVVWGKLNAEHPPFEPRLRLKNFHPEDSDAMYEKSDMTTSTAKYDGSSAYLVTNKKGTRLWSPRHSTRTGDRIEYTFMFPELAMHTSDETIIAMGELLFRRDGWLEAIVPNWFLRPRYLPQAQGSGILNAHALRPRNVIPEIRIYRMDKIGRTKTVDLPFFENRDLQSLFAETHPNLDVVENMLPLAAKALGFEGVVTAPHNSSINEGFKLKWWRDPDDWTVTDVSLRRGDKGGIAGTVGFKSLESGRSFKLGPGQLGNHAFNEMLMEYPEDYVGRVARVQSKHGHEGRAATFVDWHDDK